MRQLIAFLLCAIAGAAPAYAVDPGADLFQNGTGAVAVLLDGQLRAPASRFTCAGCHGSHAQGKREGGITIPALSWQVLSDPSRPGGAYDADLFQRAVTKGIGADGRALDAVMPRFDIDEPSVAALIGYLQSVHSLDRVGISATAVTLLASPDPEVRTGYAAAAYWFNAQGGAFGRKLSVVETGPATIAGEDLSERLSYRTTSLDGSSPAFMAGNSLPLSAPEGLSDRSKIAFLHAMLLGEAMIECGREVTRSCLIDVLDKAGAPRLP